VKVQGKYFKTKYRFAGLLFNANAMIYLKTWGPLMVAQWLRHCVTNLKVAGSIPDGVIGIFH
jgi:hypothetical protein